MSNKTQQNKLDITELFDRQGHLIEEAMNEAVRQKIELHKKLGFPIVIWKDGQVVEIEAKNIDEYLKELSKIRA